MRVRWTAGARSDLQRIKQYIAQDSLAAAERVADAIVLRTRLLSSFPSSGRTLRRYAGRTFRELVEPPYRIVYEVHQDAVSIVAVFHARRDIPPLLLKLEKLQ